MHMKYAVLLSFTVLVFGSSAVMAQETPPEPSTNTATQAGTGQPRRTHRRIWGAGSQPTNSNGQMVTDNEGILKPFGIAPPTSVPPTETSGSAPASPQ